MTSQLITDLIEVVGADDVLTDPDLRVAFEHDFTGRYTGEATAVVRPETRDEVAAVVDVCARHGVPVVPQGGNTGVVGGGVPRGGEVLISLTRLNRIGDLDPTTGHLRVEAGATLAAVQEHALSSGWELPIDLGARDAATVGGLVATDAGGAKAFRYGTMRERVAGLALVLADGTIAERMTGLIKDNAGYLWPSLVIGSEGTLGIITDVLLRLIPRPRHRLSALLAVPDIDAALQVLDVLRSDVPSIEAVDFFFDEGVALVERVLDDVHLPVRQRSSCYLNIDCGGIDEPIEQLVAAIDRLEELIVDQAAAEDTTGRRQIWRVREALPEALVRAGVPLKIDCAVPISAIPRFTSEVRSVISATAPAAETILWGHLGDGNVHVNVLGVDNVDDTEAAVLRLAAALGGTVSAEHGVGISKRAHLGLVRSAEELKILHALKTAMDPHALMNPGVVLEPDTVEASTTSP